MHTKWKSETPQGTRLLTKYRCRQQDNIKVYLKKKRVWRCGLDSSGPKQSPVAGFCEHSNELSGSKKAVNFWTN
jgi:hypothetical protein